ncbi:uncharacterized protein LOC121425267 [Lytechinus variegatus]|uniref:uncharacterized protein LOC121425267 n=1 Tax=Lytechinus variegatus TaxID=7654 RepID=UPI001BB189A8|nr:uncharacterized protein LOC121425267 [Lytechinus variegatus]
MFTDFVILRITIGCLAAVFGIPGNLVVVGVFTRQGIKNATDVTFIALAVVDLIASIISGMKIVMVFYHDEHPWACFIEVVGARSALYAGLFLTIWIAVYRYQAVCRPFNKRIGRKTASLIAIGCAVVAFVLHIPFFFITTSVKLDSGYGCNIYGNIPWGQDVYAKTQAIVFCASALAISVLYVRIYKFIRDHQIIRQQLTTGSAFVDRDLAKTVNDKTLPTPPAIPSVSASCATVASTSEPDDTTKSIKDTGKAPHQPPNYDKTKPSSSKLQNTQSDHRTTKAVIIITVIFFIFWLPNIIIDQVPFSQLIRVKGVIIYTFYQIKYISHITNVFVYSFTYRRFRQTCCNICHSQ